MTEKEKITFKRELKRLLEKYNVAIGVNINRDTHGVTTHTAIYEIKTATTIIIEHNQTYIWPGDL